MFQTILTLVGRDLEAAANASGTPLVFTDIAVGDGNGNPVTPAEDWTFLARERYRAAINTLVQNPSNPTQFVAELIIPASVGGFVLREAALYTADGDMFAVANLPETYKPEASEGAFSDTVVRMIFEVTNASAVTIVLDPNIAIATRAWVTNSVTAAVLIPGGLTGQVLAKQTNADGSFVWVDPTAAVDVIVHSREETQTAAAAQTVFNLAILTSQGTAVYKNGTRLRESEFTVTGPTQITLAVGAAAGDKITIVQNEEVGGLTDILLKSQNFSDVTDKPQAILNLGLPAWLAAQNIAWAKLQGVPAFASRWPTYAEVTGKPLTFAPDAHGHAWSDLSDVPAFASRWPTYAEVTGKPSTFTPAAHRHTWGDLDNVPAYATRWPTYAEVTGKPATYPPDAHTHAQYLDKNIATAQTVVGPVTFSSVVTLSAGMNSIVGSSSKLKQIFGPLPYGLAEIERIEVVSGKYHDDFMQDGRTRNFVIAEQLRDVIPEAVFEHAITYNGEKVDGVDHLQLIPVLINAVKELSRQVRELKGEA